MRTCIPDRQRTVQRRELKQANILCCVGNALQTCEGGRRPGADTEDSKTSESTICDAHILQPAPVFLTHQIAAMVKLVPKIDWDALGTLRIDNRTILLINEILTGANFRVRRLRIEVHRAANAHDAGRLVDGLSRKERAEAIILITLVRARGIRNDDALLEIGNERAKALVGVIRDDRNVARIAVGLRDTHFRRSKAVLVFGHFVRRDRIGIVNEAINTGVNEREVRRVDEVFDGAISRAKRIRPAIDFFVAGVIPLRKRRNIVGWRSDAGPDEAVLFLRVMGERLGLFIGWSCGAAGMKTHFAVPS